MRQQETRDLFLYWNRLRGTDAAPHRNSIEPSDIRDLLPQTFILQRLATGTVEFRLAGTAICNHFGKELRGRSFDSLFNAGDRRMLLRLVDQALNGSAISVISMDGYSQGGQRVEYELLLLPLAVETQGERVFGSAVPGEKPYWLGTDPVSEWKLRSIRIIDPERENEFVGARPAIKVPSLAPSKRAMILPPRLPDEPAEQGRKVAHLTVLNGGRND